MFLIAGLGNPGKEYEKTRHNVGFWAVDLLAERYRFPNFTAKHHGLAAKGKIEGQDVLLLKPQTFMNRSGISVGEAARFYQIPLSQIWVIHDELDLPTGKLRTKIGGGAGGHNGLKSIDSHLGKEYGRVRLGIDHPGERADVSNYVLSNFNGEEWKSEENLLNAVAEALPLLLEGAPDKFMNRVVILTGQEA